MKIGSEPVYLEGESVTQPTELQITFFVGAPQHAPEACNGEIILYDSNLVDIKM